MNNNLGDKPSNIDDGIMAIPIPLEQREAADADMKKYIDSNKSRED